jgi:hypothetical protein
MKVKIQQGQWLGDVVIRETGDIHRIVEMAVMNGIPVTENIPTGTELLCPPVASENGIADYYRAKEIYPATALEYEPGEPGESGGIGYMEIGITFIVS